MGKIQKLSYKVTVIDEEENKLEKRFAWLADAMKFANQNKYAQINTVYS